MTDDSSDRSYQDVEREVHNISLQFKAAAMSAAVMLATGTVFYHQVEHFKWLDSVYFCTVTLTTVGYGDFVPKTDAGKIFTIFYVLIGIGILAFFANLLIKRAAARRELRRFRRSTRKSAD